MKTKGKIDWKNSDEVNEYRKDWRKKHKDRLNREARERSTPESRRESWDNIMFGGNVQEVLERDKFQCQVCGMSQEQHLILFNRRLEIHHKDFMGRRHPNTNNDIENLQTLCIRCHARVHRKKEMRDKYGELLEQDDSKYRYPRIRDILFDKKKLLGTLAKAKEELAEELGISFWTVDHMCYERKKVPISKLRSKK